MKIQRGRGRNLKTNNGRSFTQQRIQNLLVSNKPIGSVITFTRILVLIIVNVQAFVDRCKNVKRCASNTRLFPMISHRHWWWYCITSYSINPSWSPFLSHFFLFLNNFLLYSNLKKTRMIKFWGTKQTKITKDGKWGWWRQGRREKIVLKENVVVAVVEAVSKQPIEGERRQQNNHNHHQQQQQKEEEE